MHPSPSPSLQQKRPSQAANRLNLQKHQPTAKRRFASIALSFFFLTSFLHWYFLHRILHLEEDASSTPLPNPLRNIPQAHGRQMEVLGAAGPRILKGDPHRMCRKNAIVYLAQKKHSSYGRDSYGMLLKSLDLVHKNYLSLGNHANNTDLIIFQKI
jgi:hypothetical protein